MPFAIFLEIDILFSFYVFPHVSQAQAGLGNPERGLPVTSAEASSALKATVLIVLAPPVSWVLGRSRPFRGHCQQLSHSARIPPTSHSCLPGVESMAGLRCSRHRPAAVPDTALMSYAGTSQGVSSPVSGLWVEMNAVSLSHVPPAEENFCPNLGKLPSSTVPLKLAQRICLAYMSLGTCVSLVSVARTQYLRLGKKKKNV